VDFGTVDGDAFTHPRSAELVSLIRQMMRSNPDKRLMIEHVCEHAVVRRARGAMVRKLALVTANGGPVFGASPLGGEPDGFVEDVLRIRRSTNTMDLSP
jgi:mitosis inhibitor protein kinase SWE1